MSLELDLEHRLGDFHLTARISTSAGLTALFGASGSGKTTLVNLIAGLMRPDRGRIVVGGRTLVDTATNIWVPAHQRRVGYVFQESRLFPHLSVRRNLFYGRWFLRGQGAALVPERVIDLLGLGALLERRPSTLSGGERQRVAIGRALLANPAILLMDEPLASLDDPRKGDILPFIERLRDEVGIPIVYVSHAVAEMSRLATTVVLLDQGRVLAVGPATDVLTRVEALRAHGPDVAAVLDVVVEAHDRAYDLTVVRCDAGPITVPRLPHAPGTRVRVLIRARDVAIATRPPEGFSALNVLPGRIESIAADAGATCDVRLRCAHDAIVARVTRKSVDALALAEGREVFAVIRGVSFEHDAAARPT